MTWHLDILASGAVYEALFLAWVACADRGWPIRAAVASAAVGAVSLYGMSAVVHGPDTAPWLLAGYGIGSWAVVRWGRQSTTPPT